ncbi:MAG TPA: ABC transporter ATP-binding protein [Flexilinea sp.]|nr:ABC transporter ATP-binding protein [Flexilinea sp.]
MSENNLLKVENLRTEFKISRKKSVAAVSDITFEINKGEIVGLVGESGCGKSVTSLSIIRLLNDTSGEITHGSVWFKGSNLLKLSDEEMRQIRGKEIAMIFQEPMTSLNPVLRIDNQLIEAIQLHTEYTKQEAREHALETLRSVGIPDPERVSRCYPHQLSGGMSQRVMIAMAMSCYPDLLIADEPTTALDVTIQAQILDLMQGIRNTRGTSILLITHDLGIVAETCSRVYVMYAGRIIEEAPVDILFSDPSHPYTQGLIASIPKLGLEAESLPFIPGSVPDITMMPGGCRFHPRCRYATEICSQKEPELISINESQKCRCWLKTSEYSIKTENGESRK